MILKHRRIIIDVISILFILLFVYAGVTKLLDYSQFVIQLKKSPLLVDISDWVSWMVPLIEIVIAFLLIFTRSRLAALYTSLTLMLTFTFYIITILNYSEKIPCSCGGILEKMGWTEHLIFNSIFCVLAIIGISLDDHSGLKIVTLRSGSCVLISGVSMTILFQVFYDQASKYSSFNRNHLNGILGRKDSVDLRVNSYYFAGHGDNPLLLGNETVDGLMMKINLESLQNHTQIIAIPEPENNDYSLTTLGRQFYLSSGTKNVIYSGGDEDLKTDRLLRLPQFFDEVTPVGVDHLAVRIQNDRKEYSLALSHPDSGLLMRPGILKKQIDGRFCVDGTMVFNKENKRLIYVYYYRNQFIVIDTSLFHPYFRRTIDSIRTAKIKVSEVTENGRRTTVMVPVVTVNKHVFTSGDLLFIHSNIRAKNDDKKMFSNSIQIDCYHLLSGEYLGSFSIPSRYRQPRDFLISGNNLFVLEDTFLIKYNIEEIINECLGLASQKLLPASKIISR